MSKPAYRSSHNVVYSSKYHLVWCPKYRRKLLVGAVRIRLVKIIRQVCAEYRVEIVGLEVMPDHVHLLA
ncbi:MAG: IS200/IS605 family transposase, partial [Actinobacteria bacterium]|nr:IS200/IS605 family transposase [Actinomycetota bacterium]